MEIIAEVTSPTMAQIIRQNQIIKFPPPQNYREPTQSKNKNSVSGPRPIPLYHIKNVIKFCFEWHFSAFGGIFQKSESGVRKILHAPSPAPLLAIDIFYRVPESFRQIGVH